MNNSFDSQKTLELIERLKIAKIGDYVMWTRIIKKINTGNELSNDEYFYILNLSRTYKDGQISRRTRIYHTKLSDIDEKPPCEMCGDKSLFYCNMNDEYFCPIHVVGHDENEF